MSTAPAIARSQSSRSVQHATSEAARERKKSAPASTHCRDGSRPASRASSAPVVDDAEAPATPRKLGTPSSHSDYANRAYEGSVSSVPSAVHRDLVFVNVARDEVVLEQYCSCTRWSRLERLLVVSVAVLVGMVVGLLVVVIVLVIADPDLNLESLFRRPFSPAAV